MGRQGQKLRVGKGEKTVSNNAGVLCKNVLSQVGAIINLWSLVVSNAALHGVNINSNLREIIIVQAKIRNPQTSGNSTSKRAFPRRTGASNENNGVCVLHFVKYTATTIFCAARY
jgi:hypothetical protein